MPFIAVDPRDNRPRIPIGVDDDERVKCPVCEELLRVRDGPTIARHFYHPPDSSCSGESALHLAMKSIAVDKLKTEYPNSNVHVEFTTDKIPRRADVLVKFDQPHQILGKGLAVEVQYRNEQKDLTETTADYLIGGYSVIWLFEENYDVDYPDYNDVELPPPISVWPFGIPHGNTDSSSTPGEYLSLTESDLISFLPNHVDGQISLGEFPSAEQEPESSVTSPHWHREKEIHLNLQPTATGVRDIYATWLDGHIKSRHSEVREEMQERWEIAKIEHVEQFVTHRFSEGTGNTFDFSIRVLSSLGGRFHLHQYDGAEKTTLYTQFDEDFYTSFLRLAKPLCFELEYATELLPTRSCEQVSEGTLYSYSYSIHRTPYKQVLVTVRAHGESINLEFYPEHLPALIDICAKLSLWYERFAE